MPLHIQHFHRLVKIYIRLPFGVKCALEIFQRTTHRMVEDSDGVVLDDEIVAGDETMHDKQRRCETPLLLIAASSTSTSMAEVLL